MTTQQKAMEIYSRLHAAMPNPKVELDHTSPFELLAATILAAQATDKLVNTLTPALFKKYPTIKAFSEAKWEDVDKLVNKVLFHGNKSKNIVACAQIIMEKHDGEVPRTMEELDALPGVARKTANVVLGVSFGVASGIVIDTHGIRLSNKLGLSKEKDPVKIERDLMALVPQKHWIEFGHLLTLHGRHMCIARPHTCDDCPLGDLCPEYNNTKS